MNNIYPCDTVRDLMPLVIDEVASERSCEIVREHVAVCAECRARMDSMRAPLEKPETGGDFARFVKTTGRRLRRRRIAALVCIVLALAVVVMNLPRFRSCDVDLAAEDVVFALNEHGFLTVTCTLPHGSGFVGMDSGGGAGQDIVYFNMYRTRLPDLSGQKETGTITQTVSWIYWGGEALLWENVNDEDEAIGELRVGTEKDYFVLYRQGDVLQCGHVIERP